MESLIRSRTGDVLDSLPVGQPFDWVPTVSKELTGRMLATLLDFPYDERDKLIYWSDLLAGAASATGGEFTDEEAMFDAAADMARDFSRLWRDKQARRAAGEAPGFDLISLLQSSEDTRDLINRRWSLLAIWHYSSSVVMTLPATPWWTNEPVSIQRSSKQTLR